MNKQELFELKKSIRSNIKSLQQLLNFSTEAETLLSLEKELVEHKAKMANDFIEKQK